ncbi:hypothetical protein J6590_053302 [Homalodisca vitripennis]|nr:hypothetical protein J6590_053302 [Homalodisca vitripennis]
MFNTSWDVDRYRIEHESDEHWGLRRQFMVAHKEKYPEDRLVCLTQVFFNMEFLGCRYPHKTMELVNRLAKEVAEEFRESRKGRLKRTFVGAQDAAGAKAKGSKPPLGAPERFATDVPGDDVDQGSCFVGSKPPLGALERFATDVRGDDVDQGSAPKRPRVEKGNAENQPEIITLDDDKPKPDVNKKSQSDIITLDDDDDDDDDNDNDNKSKSVPDTKDVTADAKELAKTFVLMIPPRTNSMTEQDSVNIIRANFPGNQMSLKFNGSKEEGGWTCELWVNPTAGSKQKPPFCIASCFKPTQREGKQQASANAVATLKKFCTYIEPNPTWFKEGRTPDFIEKRIPCKKNPRSYLIMTKKDTGHITPQVAEMLLTNFQKSSNEDMFFIDTEYNEKEKIQLMNSSQKFKLGFRHFGSKKQLKDHHVCIYKEKPAAEVVEEARKWGGKHPKFLVTLKKP